MPNTTFTLRSPMPVSADELYAWHARPLAFERLQPPWEKVEVLAQEGTFGSPGYRVTVRTPAFGPFSTRVTAGDYIFHPGEWFQDRQMKGPFAHWVHTHTTAADRPGASFLEDRIEYRLPLGMLGRLVGGRMVRKRLARMFAYRHALTASDLRRHAPYRDRPRLTVLVTGSHGLIGSALVPLLTTGGHRVVRLVTGLPSKTDLVRGKGVQSNYNDGTKCVPWNPAVPLPARQRRALAEVDAVVHLAGYNVAAGRWTADRTRKISASRLDPTKHIADAIAALPPERRPRVFVSASAVGFYGDRGDETLTEESDRGDAKHALFPSLCRSWELATRPAADAGVRVVNLRTGVVLTPKGGALGKQLFAFRAGLGAVLGTGRQWVPWVTIGDAVGAIHHCLMNEAVRGPVNVTAPNPVTNREFTKTLGRVLRRPAIGWLPGWVLRAAFGGMADEALLASTRAVPRKLLETGFAFDYPELEAGLRFVLGR